MSNLYTEDNGKGQPTLVFLHYFGGSSRTWRFVVDILSDRFRCICLDLPGFGGSAEMLMDDYSVASSASSVSELLSELNVGEFVMVAHSMGAKIALQFASAEPDGLKSLILLAASPPVSEPMKDEDRLALIEMYGKPDLIRKHFAAIVYRSLQEKVLEELIEDNLRCSAAAWNSWAETGSREDISELMSGIAVPVHLVAGEFDKPLTPDYLQEVSKKYFPASKVSTILNAAHLLPIEAPHEIAELISTIAAER